MAIPTDGLVEISLTTSLGSNLSQNVWFYHDANNGAIIDMPGIAADFDLKIAGQMSLAVSSSLSFDLITVRDVLGLNPDEILVPAVVSGIQVGDALPLLNCARIDLLVSSKITRRGYKRIPGLVESQVSGDNLTPSGVTDFAAFALTALSNMIVGGVTYGPVIRGGPTKTDLTRNVVNPVTSGVSRIEVTSQVSRKP